MHCKKKQMNARFIILLARKYQRQEIAAITVQLFVNNHTLKLLEFFKGCRIGQWSRAEGQYSTGQPAVPKLDK
jgi:hypothetical protein